MRKKNIQINNGGNFITNYTYIKKKKIAKQPSQTGSKSKKINGSSKHNDYHQSSKQLQDLSSKTEVLESQQQSMRMEEQRQVDQSCYQFIMIGPLDTTYFYSFRKRVQGLLNKYNKSQLIDLLLENAKFSGGVRNLDILKKIDDDQFWSQIVISMLKNVIDQKKQKMISSKIETLVPNSSLVISLSKAQIYMMLLSMFFCIFPQQSHKTKNNYLNFCQIMSSNQKDSQSTNKLKQEKLKCIINYLKINTRRKFKDLQKNQIQIQRTVSSIDNRYFEQIQYNLSDIDLVMGKVQQRYKYDIMIDFANKKIGGGVLNRGAVQQEILFLIFPELIATICLCHQMRSNEAIIVYDAQRYSQYQGYSETFKFVGPYEHDQKHVGPFKSIIVAVDATDFKFEGISQLHQYKGYYIDKQLIKFITGIQGAQYGADQSMSVCTGRWGCGAFGGDPYLKFTIQWIACSLLSKSMRFMCQSQQEQKQLSLMVKFLKKFNSLQLLQAIREYDQNFQITNTTQVSFLQFLKKYIC